MKKLKKVLSLVLVMAFIFSLASCTAKVSPADSSATSKNANENTSAEEKDEIVTLRWATVGNGMPKNYDAWAKNINKYLGEKIGVNIEMEVVPWGDWDNRRNVIVNTSSDFDILFTNSNTYVNDVHLGAFLEIGEMIKTTAPNLYKLIPEEYWTACNVDGKIYGIPTYKDSSQTEYFVWDKKLAKELNIDTKSLTTLPSLTDAFKAIKKKTGKPAFPQSSSGSPWVHFEYDNMCAGLAPLGVRFDDKNAKVVSVFEQQDIMDNLTLMHQWYKDGYINADAATLKEGAKYKAVGVAQGWSGAAITSWGPGMGVEAEAYQWKDTIISNESVQGSLSCISVNCKYPDKALKFLELVNTDTYVRDSFYYGLEGDDFKYTDDKKVHRNKTDWTMAGYTQGTFFTVTQTDDVTFNQWDEVKQLNEKAKPSVMVGFTINTKPVADKFANCIEIYTRYRPEITTGAKDPKVAVPQMMKELRAAGFDEIVTETQKQVDAFMAAKK